MRSPTLIILLLIPIFLIAAPFAVAPATDNTFPPTQYTFQSMWPLGYQTAYRSTFSLIPLFPAPLLPRSPAPLHPRTECNRPATDMPPAPDGCPDWTPIAPPPAPIPLPCLTIWVSRSYWDIGTAVALHIRIDHPELSTTASTYTKLSKLVRPGESWELVDADWEVSCGKDEAPLVWALFEVLNKGKWDALDIYSSPLPEGYVAVLRELASLRNFIYLPYLEVQQ